MDLSPPLIKRLKASLGSAPVSATAISGGYSPAKRLLITLADGRKIFAKIGSNPDTAAWLRKEFRIYSYLARAEGVSPHSRQFYLSTIIVRADTASRKGGE